MTTSRAAHNGRRRGFTLVELMVATALSGLVLAGVLATTLQIVRGGVRLGNYAEMNTQIARALEQFGADARLATDLVWNNASDVTLSVPDAAGAVSAVTYAWRADTAAFFRVPGTSSATTNGRVILVRDLPAPAGSGTAVTFERLNRSSAAATTNAATKFLRVSFTLSRTDAAAGASTQRANAVFALRNKPAS